jgi:hypothetical protein
VIRFFTLAIFTLSCNSLFAITPADVLAAFKAQASTSPDFKEFSIERGSTLFKTKPDGADVSCSSCHTENPAAYGKNSDTNKEILPLAPAANPDRFTDMAKVDKWFKRNCNDVFERECTAQEKGDVLAYLISVEDSVAFHKANHPSKKRIPASKKAVK